METGFYKKSNLYLAIPVVRRDGGYCIRNVQRGTQHYVKTYGNLVGDEVVLEQQRALQ